jgi:hypothetical protein
VREWPWRLYLTRRARLEAHNAALRKALLEADVLIQVWRISAEHHDATLVAHRDDQKPEE